MGGPLVSTDHSSDPLPKGAVARLGTSRFRVAMAVESLAVAPDGKTVACTDRKGVLYVFDATNGKVQYTVRKEGFLSGAAFSPDGSTLACLTNDLSQKRFQLGVHLRDPASGR